MSIKFVGLHAHSVAGSIFDALGFPQEHMEFAYSNGSDALALTDHGNMNGLSYQVLHAKKMKKEGKNFKPIFGCEAYFIPSISEWRSEYERIKAEEDKSIDDSISGATVEDEAAAKKENKSILNRRRHLVLLAQNQKGLNNIFKLISESYKTENFYRYPRIDYSLLEKYNEGIIALSACLGGVYAGCYWENRDKGESAVLSAFRDTTKRMMDIFGDRWYGELQWNDVAEQHELNRYIIRMHEEFGIKLVSTADSHYPNPNAWKDRELYKRLGWLGKGRPDWAEGQSQLPAGVDEIGYELYPKNGEQMWEMTMDWRHRAACRDVDPELFFPVGNTGPAIAQIEEARKVCMRCEVREPCLQWALESGQDSGVWGGLSEDGRRAMKRRAARNRARLMENQIPE